MFAGPVDTKKAPVGPAGERDSAASLGDPGPRTHQVELRHVTEPKPGSGLERSQPEQRALDPARDR
jgi:hypothetical protein